MRMQDVGCDEGREDETREREEVGTATRRFKLKRPPGLTVDVEKSYEAQAHQKGKSGP